MSTLVWDDVGKHYYEAGVDRGVLYIDNYEGVSWSGLVNVVEEYPDFDTAPQYLDGVKYADNAPYTDFSGTISALTYPDVFEECQGFYEWSEGFGVDNQPPKPFGFSYQTKIGNDTEGIDHAYQIHVVYNATAVISETTHETLSDASTPVAFAWNITTQPVFVDNYRPTAHIIFDSRYLDQNIITTVESFLYGGVFANAYLPSINDFVTMILNWDPKIIVANTTTGMCLLTPGLGDLTPGRISGLYMPLANTRLRVSSLAGLYTLTS